MVLAAICVGRKVWIDKISFEDVRLPHMKELIGTLVAKADLSEAQATKVADVVRGFLSEKLPEPLKGPVLGALTGQQVDSALDQAKGVLGKLF